ncbi:MAG: S1 RNA-binding domain-containing protein [Proteobacteria bacterium]|nr:S1 RNA-binding domain-containing protein [Pseudomonadota bacterium]
MESFEELLKMTSLESLEGVVTGQIVRKSNDGILVDLKSKAEKFISRAEFLEDEWNRLKEGDEIQVFVESGRISYSKGRKLLALAEINESFDRNEPILVKLMKTVKGGLLADYKGIEIFIPHSQIGKDSYNMGVTIEVLIKNIEDNGRKIIGSISEYQKLLKEKKIDEFFKKMKVGDVVSGVVKGLIEKGIFVNVEGLDCFVPFSELTYKRIKRPDEMFKVGDRVEAKIIDLKPEEGKATLSLKALEEDPWQKFLRNYKENDKVKGIVRSMIDKGVFVEIIDGVDGFLHVSEISWTERVNNPKKYFKVGDHIECLIKKIDKEGKKVSLSFREMLTNPWEDFLNENPIGSILKVKIKKIIEPGIVLELTNDLEGFVPNENISWKYVNETKKGLKEGDEIKVKLMAGDAEKKRLIFSIKDLSEDPWENFVGTKKVGDEIDGVIKKIMDNVIIVEVAPYIEGIVKKSEFIKDRREQIPSEGQNMTFIIKEFDQKKKRVLLSYLDLLKKRDEEAMEELKKMNTTKVTLGDFFK